MNAIYKKFLSLYNILSANTEHLNTANRIPDAVQKKNNTDQWA